MTTVLDLFGSEVWRGRHAPLVLGWSDEQLGTVVEVLQPFLPGGLTPAMVCAAAACARSLAVDNALTGKPVHYSRNTNHYGKARYRRGARYYSFHYVTKAMDMLEQAGLAGQERGQWISSGSPGRETVAWPTDALLELLAEAGVDLAEPRGEPYGAEVIVLRDREDKSEIDYDDTEQTIAMRTRIEALNAALGELELFLYGAQFPIPALRRIFNGDFDHGGRLYCRGRSWQIIPAEDREGLHLRVDGVLRHTVEIDYSNQHAVIGYTEAGLALPPGDQYLIDGFHRDLVKRAFNILLNAMTRKKAVGALSEELRVKDLDLWKCSGLTNRRGADCKALAEKVVEAVEEKHQPIKAFFGSDAGAAFMRKDSEMAVEVMERVLAETGRCPLPVHDSFLVPDLDQEVLVTIMQEVAAKEGLPLCLKDSSGLHRWDPPATSPLLY